MNSEKIGMWGPHAHTVSHTCTGVEYVAVALGSADFTVRYSWSLEAHTAYVAAAPSIGTA